VIPTDEWNKTISQRLSALCGQEDGVGYVGKKLVEMRVWPNSFGHES